MLAASALSCPAAAQSARDLLTQAAFQDRNAQTALARVDKARATAQAELDRDPADADAAVVAAIALGYRAKLTGERSEALAARRQFEALVARYPKNAEAQAGLGAWHLGIILRVGRLMGRAGAGAREAVGLSALDRSVQLGGNRAFFAGLAGMLRINYDRDDAVAFTLIETAARAPTPTPIDRIMQRSAQAVLAVLRRGDRKGAQTLADRLLPFGWYNDKNR
ncbi:hypothetical protein GCM10011380_21570 [Sphingomonas metalli]|uniref:Uncharacterized protein n=1 Tax=Sphingomonas metalli TaxID=1779358 RepID=A0A916T6K4_9SPHN|nr:hypothetical protein [Sphingomonas metalli]GGB31862.1 hypothetical protein GCM10011380_21570 [Sphingomonas metalli]